MRFSLADLRQWLRNAALIALGLGILDLGMDYADVASFCVVFTAFGLPSVIYHIWFKEADEDRAFKRNSALWD